MTPARSVLASVSTQEPLTAPARQIVEIASLRRRLASMLYESLLLLGVLALAFLLPLTLLGLAFGASVSGWVEWLHIVVVCGAYFIWLWQRNGQTLAMQTWQLQIVDQRSGEKPSIAQCFIRYAVAWPSILLLLSGVGLLWTAFVDRDRQFLHDRVAGTCVVFNPNRPSATE